jgi:hypothetical protein
MTEHERTDAVEEPKLYGLIGWKTLKLDLEAAVEQIVEDAWEEAVDEEWPAVAARMTWPLRISVYRTLKLPKPERLADRILEYILEYLDEDYGYPEGDGTKPTESMQTAAIDFAKAIIAGYVPWAYEPTGEVVEVTQEQANAIWLA